MSLLSTIKNRSKYLFGALIGQMLLTQEAFAQFTPPPPTDMSRQFINQIFGSLLDGGPDAFGQSIATLNGAVLIIGGILVAYTIFAGTLGTAHDGEMLGKKFSSVWVPVRTALGTALVMPVMGGGYCVMQAIVMWLIMQGASLGNMIWSSYMENPPIISGKIDKVGKESIKKFVEDVYLAQVCVESQKKATSEVDSLIQIKSYDYKVDKDLIGWQFGDWGGVITDKNGCGTVPRPKKPEIKVASTAPTSLTSLNSMGTVFKSPNLIPIYDAHIEQINTVIIKTGELAAKAIDKNQTVSYAELDKLTTDYINAVQTSATGLLNDTGISQTANTQGWFMAGTWATQMVILQNKINSAVGATPTVEVRTLDIKDASSDTASMYAAQGYKLLSSQRPELLNMSMNPNTKDATAHSTNDVDMGGKIAGVLTKMFTSLDLEEVKNDKRHPLMLMSQVGNRILNAIIASIAAAAALSALGISIAGFQVDLVPAYIAVFTGFAFPLVGFLGVGGMLAYILPNTPFLIWIGIIIGWTIMVVEAIIAAPLWAVMHLHPSGDDMTGKGGQGYMLVLGLILRPALIIFGLIAAIVLSDLFGKFVNMVFFDLFSANSMQGSLGFFSVLFGTGLYAAVMFMVIKNTYNLMHIIPDQLMRWIGGGGEQLGQYANQINEGAVQKGAAIGGAALGFMVKDGMQTGAQGMNAAISAKKHSDQANAQRTGNQINQLNGYSQKDLADGQGAGAIDQKIDEEYRQGMYSSGGAPSQESGLNAMRDKSTSSNAAKTLGGKDSPYAAQYRQGVLERMDKGASFSQAHQEAFKHAFDSKFGEGAYDVANTIAQNDAPGNQSLANLSMERTAQAFQGKMNNLMKKGGMSEDEARAEVSQMAQSTLGEYQNKGGNIKSILAEKSKEINKNVLPGPTPPTEDPNNVDGNNGA